MSKKIDTSGSGGSPSPTKLTLNPWNYDRVSQLPRGDLRLCRTVLSPQKM